MSTARDAAKLEEIAARLEACATEARPIAARAGDEETLIEIAAGDAGRSAQLLRVGARRMHEREAMNKTELSVATAIAGFSAALGAPLADKKAKEWIAFWCEERSRLLAFEPLEGMPCVPGLGENAGGYRAQVDLEDRVGGWMRKNAEPGAPVTVEMLDRMEADLSVSSTWLCEPDSALKTGDRRLEILEASGQ